MSRSHQYRIRRSLIIWPRGPFGSLSVFVVMLEMSRFVHSLHISWYTISILYNSDAEEIPPLFQPPMLHFQVVEISCTSCCSRSVLCFLKPGSVVKPAAAVEDLMDHGHVRLVPPLTQCL
jgi:hypothetical protein